MLAGTDPTIEVVAAVVVAVIAIVGLFGSSRARAWVKSLFKGQSIQDMAASFADQMAGVQAAYTVSEAERHRLEAKVDALATENADLRKQIQFLGDIVTARDEVKKLVDVSGERHDELMGAVHTFGRELAKVARALEAK